MKYHVNKLLARVCARMHVRMQARPENRKPLAPF